MDIIYWIAELNNLKNGITVGFLCENLFNNSYLIRPANQVLQEH